MRLYEMRMARCVMWAYIGFAEATSPRLTRLRLDENGIATRARNSGLCMNETDKSAVRSRRLNLRHLIHMQR